MKHRMVVRTMLWASVAAIAFSTQGCRSGPSYPTPPPTPLIPTIVGVVDHVTSDGATIVLTDGTSFGNYPGADEQSFGTLHRPGDLFLARTTAPKFSGTLRPIKSGEPGCWEAWAGQTDDPIAWDQGDSILLLNGLQLPKARDYASDLRRDYIDGRYAWAVGQQGIPQYEMCANSAGQIEWVRIKP